MQAPFRTRYQNQRFGELVRKHLNRYKTERGMSMVYVYNDVSQIVGRKLTTMQGRMAAYQGGLLLGPQGQLTPNSKVSPEERINELLQVLYVVGVDEDSEMIRIIGEETGFSIIYPPDGVSRLPYALPSRF